MKNLRTLALTSAASAVLFATQSPAQSLGSTTDRSPAPLQVVQNVSHTSIETVTVTSSKLGKVDIQSLPIAITALSQDHLTATQTAGGPDLVKDVPNLTFTKTNFSSYSIQIRGIGTQAIAVTTDPAVAVAFNDTPFIRNHFFEQEFFDVASVEVLRGPQGTLYGRNATAGVVNVISARPTDHYEAMASIDVGNYDSRRLEAMLNLPLLGDKLAVRLAGEWTNRDGYTTNATNDHRVDGRNLWSGRVTIGFKPIEKLQTYLIWEHFNENDSRLRSGKALCTTDTGDSSVGSVSNIDAGGRAWLSQGCLPGSLYAQSAYGTPNAGALPFVGAAKYLFGLMPVDFDPYGATTQANNLRIINASLDPQYKAKSDTLQFEATYALNSSLSLVSQTAYSKDYLYSTQDYNRFGTVPGAFINTAVIPSPMVIPGTTAVGTDGEFCDPQLGCSSSMLGQDLSRLNAEQFSQEIRLSSNFAGPLNFSLGANYLNFKTKEDYYVFFNLLTLLSQGVNQMSGGLPLPGNAAHIAFDPAQANSCGPTQADLATLPLYFAGLGCAYVDPNPINAVDGQGHNYFRNQNPYRLNSWAGFGEVTYQATPDLKLTGGLRLTHDNKRYTEIPSWALIVGKGSVITGISDQSWSEVTGRAVASWTPELSFTDASLFYASYSRGYKGGGANPPGALPLDGAAPSTAPRSYAPEFVNAYELGSKNTLVDGTLMLNASAFFYDYKNYQVSQIMDRTSVNTNFNATIKGAEIEALWEPVPGLRLNFTGGFADSALAKGSTAIDIMDRADATNHPDWMVVKPYVTQASNCILPTSVVNAVLYRNRMFGSPNDTDMLSVACLQAYTLNVDPVTLAPYEADPLGYGIPPGYAGFNPTTAPNNGNGFAKDLSGNALPNTPPFTLSAGAQYTMALTENWVGTLRGDGYWQGNSFARIFNDRPYDQLHGYASANLSLTLANQTGWQAMAYVKNVFDKTAITGAFLNSDDMGLQTNIFLTDPRLFGLRLTKSW